jgi:hypothetical protein
MGRDPGSIRTREAERVETEARPDRASYSTPASAITRSAGCAPTSAPFLNARGFALHVGCAHGRNHELLALRSQFAHIFGSEAGNLSAYLMVRACLLW